MIATQTTPPRREHPFSTMSEVCSTRQAFNRGEVRVGDVLRHGSGNSNQDVVVDVTARGFRVAYYLMNKDGGRELNTSFYQAERKDCLFHGSFEGHPTFTRMRKEYEKIVQEARLT